MTWYNYPLFMFIAAALWVLALILLAASRKKMFKWIGGLALFGGLASMIIFTTGLWISLERPPFRTLGETRLWYALFISVIGIVIYYRWKLLWMLAYALLMAIVFLFVNYLNPDTFDKTLMPALQSPWFIPHVIVYIIGYAFLAVSSLIGVKGLYLNYKGKDVSKTIALADNIVYLGFAFLTFGLLFGALWAKEAWGHYWTWDPKETWAFLTWLVYLLYIHFRVNKRKYVVSSLWVLSLAFVVLLICWFGINYLPSAQSSVHVYST
ncbi:MAG: cytochrome c biogenesis protein CcsA [Bacteroidales bacterium]|nr:cytochrome c biogenesis protein CcsA [Bacteroidales bacterium]MCF8343882.1 cytochrome c biogenesis protein CcsA [Bacteroidales bacterium]MCF8377766.1 cytochrome c biogenesis protein CcsA [Bacteroidales bacterium]